MSGMRGYATPIVRFYIDVRPAIPEGRQSMVELPLLESLSQDQQDKVKAFMRPADRLMSLASALLKYVFIHRYARIPWDEVRISKTPDPHRRPYWDPGAGSTGGTGLEFNVSHQNGLVTFIGCQTPHEQSQAYAVNEQQKESAYGSQQTSAASEQVRLGIDIACTNEHGRTPADITTQSKLDEWVDIFEEMFSDACRKDMKTAAITHAKSPSQVVQQRFRRFYAYWSLKEAYIKMVGEGLLADWLAKLEFQNVTAPEPPMPEDFPDDGFSWALRDEDELKWTPPDHAVRDVRATLYGQPLRDVKLCLVAFENTFLCATATRGVRDATQRTSQERWIKLDIERDIRPCAEGTCKCLEGEVPAL
jgi:4'-phosphopantetheinyl transferase